MSGIKSINVNLPMHSESYAVGQPPQDSNNIGSKITEIKDLSIDSEHNYISIYGVMVSGELYKTIESSPVTLTYFREGESIEAN